MNDVPRKNILARLLYGRSFSARAAPTLVGSAFGQGVAFVMLPLAAQIYDPTVLGRVGTTLALVSVSALFLSLQYDQAVVVATDEELPPLMLLCTAIVAGWTILTSTVVALMPLLPGPAEKALASLGVNWTLPPLLFTYGMFTLLTNYRLRKNEIMTVSVARVAYYGGAAILQVVLGYLVGPTEFMFLFSQIVGSILAVGMMLPYRNAVNFAGQRPGIRATLGEMTNVARIHVKFPKYQMGAGLINAVSLYMPIFFLRALYSDTWAGWFFMAWRLIQGPMTLVSQAVGQIFYRDSAELERSRANQGGVVEGLVFGLARVSLLPTLVLWVVSPPLVERFLGASWMPVATMIQILLPAMIANFVTSPVSVYLNVRGLQSVALTVCIALFVTRLAGLGVGWPLNAPMVSVGGYSAASTVVMLLFCRYIVNASGGSTLNLVKRVLPHTLEVSLLTVVTVVLWLIGFLYNPFGLVILGIAAVIVALREYRRGGLSFGAHVA